MCFGNGPKKESVKMRGKVYVVTDGQAGSCGKGKLVGYLARKLDVDITMNHNMPNAGHTFVFDDGRKREGLFKKELRNESFKSSF